MPGILITGGAGYIGSHTVVERMAAGEEVFIIDNLCNSKPSVSGRIEHIAGRRPGFARVDLRYRPAPKQLLAAHRFGAVILFAGLKAVFALAFLVRKRLLRKGAEGRNGKSTRPFPLFFASLR